MPRPLKPYPEFPLFPDHRGQWVKKIRGKRHYFGPWGNWQAALDKYLEQKDALHAGRTPRASGVGLTLLGLCDLFLDQKETEVDSGEIKASTYREYKHTCQLVVDVLGKGLAVATLGAQDFIDLRLELAKRYKSKVTLGNKLRNARTLFTWAVDVGHASDLPFKKALKSPSSRVVRVEKNAKPKQLYTPAEIKRLIKAARGWMKPAILLAINGGLGNQDIADLRWSHIDGEWLTMPRGKTGISRRVWLWPETRAELAKWKKKCKGDLFTGSPIGYRTNNGVAHAFTDLPRGGKGFYDLRHTYRTVADECLDQVAIAATMGHVDRSIAAHYRHKVSDERLKAAAEVVRGWLFSSQSPSA